MVGRAELGQDSFLHLLSPFTARPWGSPSFQWFAFQKGFGLNGVFGLPDSQI